MTVSKKPVEEPKIAILALVRGHVQGVGFRYEARSVAKSLGIKGWVMNLADGGVETWAEGTLSAVKRYQTWLEKGPPGANVSTVEVSERPPRGDYQNFIIEF